MKIVSTTNHARIDYLTGLFFMSSPWILGFKESVAATWIMLLVGLAALIMSLFTNYEGGMVRSIPMRIHLTVDIFMAAFLASSPWLFGFAEQVFLPQLMMGLFQVLISLVTSKYPAEQHSERVVDRQ